MPQRRAIHGEIRHAARVQGFAVVVPRHPGVLQQHHHTALQILDALLTPQSDPAGDVGIVQELEVLPIPLRVVSTRHRCGHLTVYHNPCHGDQCVLLAFFDGTERLHFELRQRTMRRILWLFLDVGAAVEGQLDLMGTPSSVAFLFTASVEAVELSFLKDRMELVCLLVEEDGPSFHPLLIHQFHIEDGSFFFGVLPVAFLGLLRHPGDEPPVVSAVACDGVHRQEVPLTPLVWRSRCHPRPHRRGRVHSGHGEGDRWGRWGSLHGLHEAGRVWSTLGD
mmetsp:Transcript_1061/g.1885  ORF Transcript_1061/g.1885 Transcript_1061/m.1885 type:complete len:279 (-) Transcript_1061:519-1355(-)